MLLPLLLVRAAAPITHLLAVPVADALLPMAQKATSNCSLCKTQTAMSMLCSTGHLHGMLQGKVQQAHSSTSRAALPTALYRNLPCFKTPS